jgi:Skp family chaperone for outer membrane proteins
MFARRRFAPATHRLSSGMAAAGALVLGAAFAGDGLAQPAAPAPTFGPPLAGVCMFARAQALEASQAGVSAGQQIQQFDRGVRAELDAERAAIVSDDRALAAQKATLPAAAYQQRVGALKQRYAELDRTTQLRGQQLAKTRADAVALISRALDAGVAETITARHCSVVFERAGSYGSNAGMDITAQVIQQMNERLPGVTLRLAPPESVGRPK